MEGPFDLECCMICCCADKWTGLVTGRFELFANCQSRFVGGNFLEAKFGKFYSASTDFIIKFCTQNELTMQTLFINWYICFYTNFIYKLVYMFQTHVIFP